MTATNPSPHLSHFFLSLSVSFFLFPVFFPFLVLSDLKIVSIMILGLINLFLYFYLPLLIHLCFFFLLFLLLRSIVCVLFSLSNEGKDSAGLLFTEKLEEQMFRRSFWWSKQHYRKCLWCKHRIHNFGDILSWAINIDMCPTPCRIGFCYSVHRQSFHNSTVSFTEDGSPDFYVSSSHRSVDMNYSLVNCWISC